MNKENLVEPVIQPNGAALFNIDGINEIVSELRAALINLKEEKGGCLTTKLHINKAITICHDLKQFNYIS